jgi:hypothetical protein
VNQHNFIIYIILKNKKNPGEYIYFAFRDNKVILLC